MTNGEPVVVRGAMKPLPTLTKPLRSVDIATKEPAQALRERTDSCTVPAGGRGGRGHGGAGARLRLPGEVRRRPHRRRARRARRLPRADRMEARVAAGQAPPGRACERALVLVGFMGAGKSTAARTAAAELGVEALDSDRELERRLGEPIQSFFDREGEAAFRAREEEVVLELLGRRPRRGGGARRRRRAVRARCARRCAPTPSCSSRSTPWTPGGARPGGGRPLARDQARFEQLQRDRAAALRGGGRRRAARQAAATRSAPRCPALDGARRGAAGHAARLGRLRLGRLPGVLRPRA